MGALGFETVLVKSGKEAVTLMPLEDLAIIKPGWPRESVPTRSLYDRLIHAPKGPGDCG